MSYVGSLLERPKAYYNIDGVGELGIGFMCLSWSLLGWLQLHTPKTSVWNQMYTFLIYVAVMTSIIHYGSKAIKNRITYPRTGFVDYRPRDKYWIPMAVGFSVSAVMAAGIAWAARRHWEISTPASLLGLLFAAGYIRIARTVAWKWLMFVILLVGTVIVAILPGEMLESFANDTSPARGISPRAAGAFWMTFVIYGAVLLVSGGISFWLYVHHTQAPAREGE